MADPIKFVVEFDLGENGGRWTFNAIEEVEGWFKKEMDAWRWVEAVASKYNEVQTVWNSQSAPWQDFRNRLARLRQALGSQEEPRFIKELQTTVTQVYQTGRPLLSTTTKAKHVEIVRQTDPVSAAYVLWFYLGLNGNGSLKCIQGAFLAMAQEYGLRETAATERAQLAALQGTWQAFREESKTTFTDFSAQFTSLQQCIATEQTAHKAQFDQLVAESKGSLSAALKAGADELVAIQKTYDEKMALQASVTYWKTKADSHRRLAFWFSGAAVVAFGIVGYGLYETLRLIGGTAKISELELWKAGLVVIVATVGVWFIRILVRLLLSNIHLFADASERRTMMMTYLALMRRDQLPKGNERELILQSLFRPSSTGIVKDDAAPPFMAEWLKRTTGAD